MTRASVLRTLALLALGAGMSVPATPIAAQEARFSVPSGAVVVIRSPEGDITVQGRGGADGVARLIDSDDEISVRQSGRRVHVEPVFGEDGDLIVELPRSVSIEVVGIDGDISIEGVSGSVSVETFDGDVTVDGASETRIRSIDGDVRVRRVSGPVVIDYGDGDMELSDIDGAIEVIGIDGDVSITDADTRELLVETIAGDLFYDGTVYDEAEYTLSTHSGDVTFALPNRTGATVSVLTYDGSLIPSFPLEVRGSIGSIAEFTLGGGGAQVRLESFDGNIYLVRPGERTPDREHR